MSFHCDAYSIEGMVWEKMISSNFDGAADTWRWGWQALGARTPSGLTGPGLQTHGSGATLGAKARPTCMAANPGKRVFRTP